jgi:hypothetical protein
MTLKRLIFAVLMLLVLCVTGYIAILHFIKLKTIGEIHRTVSTIHFVEKLDFNCLDVGFSDPKLTIKDISIQLNGQDDNIIMEKFLVHDVEEKDNLVTRLQFTATGIQVPVHMVPIPVASTYTGKTAIDNVLLNLNCHYSYDPVSKVFHLQNFTLVSKETGELYISFKLLNLHLTHIAIDNPVTLFSSLAGVSVGKATIIYKDHSFLQNLIKHPQTPENAAIKKIIDNINVRLASLAHTEKNPNVLKVLLTIKQFLIDPDRIEIKLSPEKPVLLGQLLFVRDLEKLIRLLNIQVARMKNTACTIGFT